MPVHEVHKESRVFVPPVQKRTPTVDDLSRTDVVRHVRSLHSIEAAGTERFHESLLYHLRQHPGIELSHMNVDMESFHPTSKLFKLVLHMEEKATVDIG